MVAVLAVMESLAVPEPGAATEVGLKVAVMPLGTPET
jgi:hypothetical protein